MVTLSWKKWDKHDIICKIRNIWSRGKHSKLNRALKTNIMDSINSIVFLSMCFCTHALKGLFYKILWVVVGRGVGMLAGSTRNKADSASAQLSWRLGLAGQKVGFHKKYFTILGQNHLKQKYALSMTAKCSILDCHNPIWSVWLVNVDCGQTPILYHH